MFFRYEQHDANDFLMCLMDGLHEDVNRITQKPATERVDYAQAAAMSDTLVAREVLRRYLLRDDSLVHDHCLGFEISRLTCDLCGAQVAVVVV